jgi:ankyrin repeat protein
LHYSVVNGASLDIVKILIDAGCDLQSKTGEGKTAADLALDEGDEEIGKFLQEYTYPPIKSANFIA